VESLSTPLVDYVGSVKKDHILFPPMLAANPVYWLNNRVLEGVTSHAKLVAILTENRAAMLDLQAKDAESKSLLPSRSAPFFLSQLQYFPSNRRTLWHTWASSLRTFGLIHSPGKSRRFSGGNMRTMLRNGWLLPIRLAYGREKGSGVAE
jgi:hypothetical protein